MGSDDGALVYQNILLGGKGGMNPGQLKVHPEGFVWRKTGGNKVVEVAKEDISSILWMRAPKGYQLALRLKAGSKVKFNGFREQDIPNLSPFMTSHLGQTPKEKEIAVSGRNWGDAEVEGSMLSFNVGGKQAFEIAIADVSQTQMQGKNEVMLELHVDDTTGANEKDTLMELSFHVPNTNSLYLGDDEKPSAQVFKDKILARADVGPSGDQSVVDFEGVHILTPRGRFKVELHISFLRLQGQAMDFKIQYAAVVRIFVLPKANQPHTFVVVMLDPPIRKGQTFYPHLVLQFPNEDTMSCQLSMGEDLLEGKYKGRLEATYKGLVHEVFSQVLKGLSETKVTRPGTFRSNSDGYAVRTSLKAEEGYLYPLEKSFFFLPKPPTLITHDEVEHVEFERHGAGSSSVSSSYFDLVIRLKSDSEHQFRNIQRNEYHNLFNFFSLKKLKILNLGESKAVAPGGSVAAAFDDGADPYLNIKTAREGGPAGESDEEDEDFVADKDDDGSPSESDGEGEEGEDAEEGASDAEDKEEDEEEDEEEEEMRPKESEKKKEKAKMKEREKPAKAATPAKRKKKDEDEEGGGTKKKKAKKDPNAPKRGLSAFLLFSQDFREQMKRENPKLGFGEMGRALGDKWKSLSAEEKEPYEERAKEEKARYQEKLADYKGKGGNGGGGGGGGGGGEDIDDD